MTFVGYALCGVAGALVPFGGGNDFQGWMLRMAAVVVGQLGIIVLVSLP